MPPRAIVCDEGDADTAKSGAAVTVKLLDEVAVPPGVVTAIGPVVAPLGTVAVICESDPTVNDPAWVPLKPTADAPVKPLPGAKSSK